MSRVLAFSEDGRHILVETASNRGYIEDTKLNIRTEEKSIAALLSANIDWSDKEQENVDEKELVSQVSKEDTFLSVKAIITNLTGQVLILKDAWSQWWDLPGGHVDDQETPEEALYREVEEETQLVLHDVESLFTRDLPLGVRTRPVVFFSAKTKQNNVVLSDEHTKYVWIVPDAIDNYNLGIYKDILYEFLDLKNIEKARQNLVPKKVPVHREGKIFRAIRWVLPETTRTAEQQKHDLFAPALFAMPENAARVLNETQDFVLQKIPKIHLQRVKRISWGQLERNIVGRAHFDGTITLNQQELFHAVSSETIVHEIGHQVHWNMREGLQGTTEFERDEIQAIYEHSLHTDSGFPSLYSKRNIQEFFAECYAIFLLQPEKLNERNPLMYAVLKKIFETPTHLRKEENQIVEFIDDPVGVGRFDSNLSDLSLNNKQISLFEKAKSWYHEHDGFIDLQKVKVAYHEHDGFQEHPVAVKFHEDYFSRERSVGSSTLTLENIETFRRQFNKPLNATVSTLQKEFPYNNISYRLKTANSIIAKANRKNISIEEMADIAGVRIEFSNTAEVLSVVKKLREMFRVLEEKDYITKSHRDKYYVAYHLTIEVDKAPVEIQLRSECHGKLANFAHDIVYKNIRRVLDHRDEFVDYLNKYSEYCSGVSEKPLPSVSIQRIVGSSL